MNNNAIIAQQTSTGFRGIHCTHRASPQEIGNILLTAYRKQKKVDVLMQGGNIVSLGYYITLPKTQDPKSITEFLDRDRGLKYQDYFFVLRQNDLISPNIDWTYVFLKDKTWVHRHCCWKEWLVLELHK